MFRVWFREIADGRLRRLAYLGHSLLLFLLVIIVGAIFEILLLLAEEAAGLGLDRAEAGLFERLSLPAALVVIVLWLPVAFAGLNMQAKRLRDIGMQGWREVSIILVAGLFIGLILAPEAGGILNAVVWLALVLVPTGAASRGGQPGAAR